MTHKQRLFVVAYLSTAHGNATKAALDAGYKSTSAPRIGHRLLRLPAISAAIEARVKKADFDVTESLERVSLIAKAPVPDKVTASDILAANTLFLRAKGALNDKHHGAGVHVTIGFFSSSDAHAGASQQMAHNQIRGNNSDISTIAINMKELSATPHVVAAVNNVQVSSSDQDEGSNEP